MPTDTSAPWWELHARSGRAVLVGVHGRNRHPTDPARLPLPEPLVAALHEWARVIDSVDGKRARGADLGEETAQLLSRRGRQLAMRVALETGSEVRYLDPFSGELNNVRWVSRPRTRRADPHSPTPWATGLTISAVVALMVAVAFVVVTMGLAQLNVLVAIVVNLAVAAGFTPSIRLGTRVLVWRWVAYGAAAGIVLAWIALLFSLLG